MYDNKKQFQSSITIPWHLVPETASSSVLVLISD